MSARLLVNTCICSFSLVSLALLTHSSVASISSSYAYLMLAITALDDVWSTRSEGLVGVLSLVTDVSVSNWFSPSEKQFSLSGPMSFSVCPLSMVWSRVDISLLLS